MIVEVNVSYTNGYKNVYSFIPYVTVLLLDVNNPILIVIHWIVFQFSGLIGNELVYKSYRSWDFVLIAFQTFGKIDILYLFTFTLTFTFSFSKFKLQLPVGSVNFNLN